MNESILTRLEKSYKKMQQQGFYFPLRSVIKTKTEEGGNSLKP